MAEGYTFRFHRSRQNLRRWSMRWQSAVSGQRTLENYLKLFANPSNRQFLIPLSLFQNPALDAKAGLRSRQKMTRQLNNCRRREGIKLNMWAVRSLDKKERFGCLLFSGLISISQYITSDRESFSGKSDTLRSITYVPSKFNNQSHMLKKVTERTLAQHKIQQKSNSSP